MCCRTSPKIIPIKNQMRVYFLHVYLDRNNLMKSRAEEVYQQLRVLVSFVENQGSVIFPHTQSGNQL